MIDIKLLQDALRGCTGHLERFRADHIALDLDNLAKVIVITMSITIIIQTLRSCQASQSQPLPSPNKPRVMSKPVPKRKAPHEILLQYMHPSTSLWPPAYLRAFSAARDGDGIVRIGMYRLARDLQRGRIVLRGGYEVCLAATGLAGVDNRCLT